MIKYELDWIDNNWRPEAFINNFKGQVGPGGGGGGGEGICKKLFFNNLYKYNILSGKVSIEFLKSGLSGLCISLSSRYSYPPFKS